jgi:hypothetical protein
MFKPAIYLHIARLGGDCDPDVVGCFREASAGSGFVAQQGQAEL